MQTQVNWIVANIGIDRVMLIPVSEPWAFPGSKGLTWTNIGRAAWTGKFVLPDLGANSRTGKPMWSGIPFDLLDVHYCDSNKLVTSILSGDPVSLATTDCGAILNPGPPTDLAWAKGANEKKTNLNIYDFRAASPDIASIQAMGNGVGGGSVPVPTPTPGPITPGAPQIDEITFLDDPTVGNWNQTSTVTSTSITNPHVQGSSQSGNVCINHTKAGQWPKTGSNDGPVEGNPWFVAKVNGQWYASTFEWLGPGATCRSIAFGIWGQYSQYTQVKAWHPQPGELIGLFVSTIARPGVAQTTDERSDIKWIDWP
jgi:hypothetical protein